MEKTYQECFEFLSAASQWIAGHEEESKFKYALTKLSRKLSRVQEKYRETVEEINIDHCATDPGGVILRDERGQYKYTKEELKKRNKKVNGLFHEVVTVEPHYATEVPETLTDLEKEVFDGFVLKLDEDKLEVVAA